MGHYFWFKNLHKQEDLADLLQDQETLKKALKSAFESVPKWVSSRLMTVLDKSYGDNPQYQQLRPLAQVMVQLFAGFKWSEIMTMVGNKQYQQIWASVFDHCYNYIITQAKFDSVVPAAYQPLFQDFKALVVKHRNLRNVPIQTLAVVYKTQKQMTAQITFPQRLQLVTQVSQLMEPHCPGY